MDLGSLWKEVMGKAAFCTEAISEGNDRQRLSANSIRQQLGQRDLDRVVHSLVIHEHIFPKQAALVIAWS